MRVNQETKGPRKDTTGQKAESDQEPGIQLTEWCGGGVICEQKSEGRGLGGGCTKGV